MKRRRKANKLAGTTEFTQFMRKKITGDPDKSIRSTAKKKLRRRITGDPNKGIRNTAKNNLHKYFFNAYDSDDDEEDEESSEYLRTPSPSELTSAEKILRDIQIQKGVERRQQSRELRKGALATMHPSTLIPLEQRKKLGIM